MWYRISVFLRSVGNNKKRTLEKNRSQNFIVLGKIILQESREEGDFLLF